MRCSKRTVVAAWQWTLAACGCLILPAAIALTPDQLLADYARQAGRTPDATRGRNLFVGRHGPPLTCVACHGEQPTQAGKHAATGKSIKPLAPAANPERFTDAARAEKWFRRNCREVLDRECTAAEKADVLGWLIQLKP